MLPAISADLPAYLLPPRSGSGDRPTGEQEGLEPSVRLDLSDSEAQEAQSRNPGVGLYGPDGHFVESTSPTASADLPFGGGTPPEKPARDLDLAQFDSVIPPAAEEELRALADRVSRKAEASSFDPRDLEQIAQLMQAVGRFDRAHWAMRRAKELERGDEPTTAAASATDAGRAETAAKDPQSPAADTP